jgi:predicted MFS family arabinose efflux permease
MAAMTKTDAYKRWAILALLFVTRAGLGFQFQTMGSVADALSQRLSLNFAEIGTLIGLFMLSGIALSIPAGFAGRHASDRTLVVLGLAALALGGAVATAADGFTVLAIGRLLCGAGFVLTTIYFTKMTADWFAGRELATAMGVLVMSWPGGIALGQVVHGWLAASYGWRLPFIVASLYCLAGAVAILALYRPPTTGNTALLVVSVDLTRREWTLTLIASVVWAAFNAAYVVYLSFAPLVLTAGGLGRLEAASIVSLASWVMIFSGPLCGQIADRTGHSDLILSACLVCAMTVLAFLPNVGWAIPLTLGFGLLGMAPAGLIMALTGAAMAPQKRAFGMGIFFSVYFLLVAPTPAIAGWLFDRTGNAFAALLFAIGLLMLTLLANLAFRLAQHRLPDVQRRPI